MVAAVVIAFVAGAVVGSFVTVLAHRIPRGESFVAGRSRCPGCGEQIAAYDNIPIASWLILRGRCRHCGESISARYPMTELGLGLLYAGTVAILGTDDAVWLALGLVFVTILMTVTLVDLELRIIPNSIVLAGAIAGLILVCAWDLGELPEHLLAAAIAGGILFGLVMVYPRGMGMGDAKLVAMIGIYLGRSVAPALLVGFAVGAVVGLAMIAKHGSAARKQAIPFGPFLALGGVVGLWLGDDIVDWYLDSFAS